jgi:regulator of extracellular matrix RemA (YlzA/DUF370 family)
VHNTIWRDREGKVTPFHARIKRLIELMRHESQLIDEEVAIYQELSREWAVTSSKHLRGVIERHRLTREN